MILVHHIEKFWSTIFHHSLCFITSKLNDDTFCSFYLSHKNFFCFCFPFEKYDLYWVEIHFFYSSTIFSSTAFTSTFAFAMRIKRARMCMQNMQKITNAFWSMSGREIGIACMQIHRDRADDKLSWNIEKLLHIFLCISSRVVVVVVAAAVCEICENIEIMMTTRTTFFERKNRFGCRIMMKDWECMHIEWFKVYDVFINAKDHLRETRMKLEEFLIKSKI